MSHRAWWLRRFSRWSRRPIDTAVVWLAVACSALCFRDPSPAFARQAFQNLKADVQGLRVTITYDLIAGASAADVYDVTLEVRIKGTGQTVPVSRTSVSGDGVGENLPAGVQKRIVWNAGADVETPEFDRYDYSLAIVAHAPTGQIFVESSPPGASITVDDETQPRGVTPITLTSLKPGPHTVVLSLNGYLQTRREGVVAGGTTTSMNVTLTPEVTAPPPTTPPGTVVPPATKPIPKWVIPVAGGGAAAALLALKGGGSGGNSTTACTFSLSPTSYPNPPQTGGSVVVSVGVTPASCTPQGWTATSNSSFVHLSASSGTGSQSITVTVDANTPDLGTPSRSGSATIAGISFPVTNQSNAVATTGNVAASEASGSATFPAFTGVTVVAGQKLTISATGTISVAGIGPVGPTGSNTGDAGSAGRLPGAPKHALICGIGGQTIIDLFYAGPGSAYATGATSPVGGVLYCGMNAPDPSGYTGNSGAWTVTVTVGG